MVEPRHTIGGVLICEIPGMKITIILAFLFVLAPVAKAQFTSTELQELLSSTERLKKAGIVDVKKVQQFYNLHGYKAAWLCAEGRPLHAELCTLISHAKYQGLLPCDYSAALVGEEDVCIVMTEHFDSLVIELRITDAATRFFTDIANGNHKPEFSYDGLQYAPPSDHIPSQILGAMHVGGLRSLANALNESMPQIKPILTEISRYINILKQQDYREEKITSANVNKGNKALCKKLFALGCMDSATAVQDSVVRSAVKQAQVKFDLLSDGVLRSTALAELNIALSTRLDRLILSVNYYRWLYALTKEQGVIVVNIPAAYLKVYQRGNVILAMRLVVGKPSTPTPTLTSQVKEVILYPYWTVPSSIIQNEMLPKIRSNPGYLNAGNYQVLDKRGKVLDPYTINWNNVSASNFPFIIRQSTGCDNALGLLKLNFYNPYTVYLHDTPSKSLFMTNKRYYSHGCMRMEKPFDLGHLVLGRNTRAIDTLEEKGCLKSQAPVYVAAEKKLPVVVWYNPVDINQKGAVVFYDDIYKKFNPVAK